MTELEMWESRSFAKDEIIFKEGDPPGTVYIIDKGRVEISCKQDGSKIALAEKETGEVFGEMALVDNKPRSATAIALEDTTCFMVDEEAFSRALNELHPLIYSIFESMAVSIREMNETQALIANIIHVRGARS